mmetsp:Transcript_107740/g.186982  ORF Transcript_107740/g.186982 Transcript_107740/m.186982 type:complete len:1153 (-) Transcript_107740:217-3675(-)
MAAGMGDSLADALQKIFAFVFGIGVAFYLAWSLALVVLVGLPLIGGVVVLANSAYSRYAKESSKTLDRASSVALETISGVRTVAALNHEPAALTAYQSSLRDVCRSGIFKGRAQAALEGVMGPIIFILFGLGLWYGSFLVSSDMEDKVECRWGVNTEPDPMKCYTGGNIMTAFLSVLFGFLGLLQALPGLTALAAARSSAASLYEIIDSKPATIDIFAEESKAVQIDRVQGRIEFSEVAFTYPARPDAPVYSKLSLVIEAGQSVALVGPSGCGKSTIVALLERFYDVGGGKILLDGTNIKDVNVRWLRSQIGLVSQEPVLFEGSIGWNISLGLCDSQGAVASSGKLDEKTTASVRDSTRKSNAHEFINEFPDQYETFVGEKGIQLSGGQKQRIAIARALISDPPILVLDEATSALDTASERYIQTALDELMKRDKRTTIIIAHRLSTIKDADKIAVISEGRVVEEGSHSELMSYDEGAYKALVQSQLSVQRRSQTSLVVDDSDKQTAMASTEEVMPEEVKDKAEETAVASESKDADSEVKKEKTKKETVPVRWLWKLCLPELPYFATGLLGSAIAGIVMPAIGLLMAEFIVVFFNDDVDEMRSESVKWAVVFMSMGAISSFGAIIRISSFSVITERMVSRVRDMAYQSILRQDIGWFDVSSDHTAGALVSQLGNDCFLLRSFTSERASLALSQAVVLIGGLYVSFDASWQLTLVVFAIIPLIVVPVIIQAKVVAKFVEASQSSFVDAGRHVSEALLHLRTIAALGAEDNRIEAFSSLLVLPYRQDVRKGVVSGIGTGVAGGVILFGAAFKYIIGGIFFDAGIVEFSDIMRCVLVLIFMAFGMSAVSKDATDKAEASVAARRVHKLITTESAIDPFSESGEAPGKPAGKIEFKEVSFAYPARKEVQVYKNMSLTIEAGQWVALAGPSGCGKSTLVSLLERFYNVDGGQILLDGRNIRSLKVSWLRQQIGLVSQEPVLFSGSIAWNISLGLKSSLKDVDEGVLSQVQEAARRANAHNFVSEFPDGYKTEVGERALQLSGGQKQRLAIARAIIGNPPILILDEATSALDATSEKVVQEALDELLKEHSRTTIVIAHRLSTIIDADKICVFSDGAVVEEGPHEALLAREGGVYRALVAHAEQGTDALVGADAVAGA